MVKNGNKTKPVTGTVRFSDKSTTQSQFTKSPMGLCDHNCIILRTNKARCTLNKEIIDLLNEESVSGARIGTASL